MNKVLVLGEHRLGDLVRHIVGRLDEELRVRVQRLIVFAIDA